MIIELTISITLYLGAGNGVRRGVVQNWHTNIEAWDLLGKLSHIEGYQ